MSGRSITHQLIQKHRVQDGADHADDAANAGDMITLAVDQVLLQDTNGPMSFLQFEAMGAARVVPRTIAYIDHNIQQVDVRNADDHRYLTTASARYGALVSRAGNGICHQVHLETFSVPGELLVGTDSHTVVCGAVGMLALGAGSIQVAVAMSTGTFRLAMPEVVRVRLTGRLRPWVTAKDVILELLRRFSVKGGGGKVFEFDGPGVAGLTVPQRATIANMGAELGLTTTVFPCDEVTREYFELVGRPADWRPMRADADAQYSGSIELDLSTVEVLVALPGSPDRVVPVAQAAGTTVDQVIVGSCTNGSWDDMVRVAEILRGKQIHPSVSVVVFPGSRRVMEAMAREGLVADLLATGVQIAGSGCGACPGLSHVPASGTRSLRTFNRNFPGRSGNRDDQVYLSSPVVAAASALTGVITDPRTLDPVPAAVPPPASFLSSPGGVDMNAGPGNAGEDGDAAVTVVRGPNIKDAPLGRPVPGQLSGPILLKLGDDISTDHISPVGVQALLLRTNIPAIAEHSFKYLDPTFVSRAKRTASGIIVAGAHYGQGSSRETAATALMVLGIRVVLARSFARIHHANLINWGIVPLHFARSSDYDALAQGDEVEIDELRSRLARERPIIVLDKRTGDRIETRCNLSRHEREILLAGGVLAQARNAAARSNRPSPGSQPPDPDTHTQVKRRT